MTTTQDARIHTQAGFDVRFDWGSAGVRALSMHVDVVVIVDVLSFGTAVEIALSAGAHIYPARARDGDAPDLARDHDALVAEARDGVSSEAPYSLSPVSLGRLPAGTRLVLPSANGGALALSASERGIPVISASLRNAKAAALASRAIGPTIAVIAAGEQWPDGGLRPSFEDLIGAGAIIAALADSSWSSEAESAAAAFTGMDACARLQQCASARDLIERGYEGDVRLAMQLDVSRVVPVLLPGTDHFVAVRMEDPAPEVRRSMRSPTA